MAVLPNKYAAVLSAVMATVLLGLCCSSAVHADPDRTRLSYHCTNAKYKENDPYRLSVDNVLETLQTVTANTPGYNLYTQSPFTDRPTAFGHGTCSSSLSAADCGYCIETAYAEIKSLCNDSIGAQVDLVDCTMRYGINSVA